MCSQKTYDLWWPIPSSIQRPLNKVNKPQVALRQPPWTKKNWDELRWTKLNYDRITERQKKIRNLEIWISEEIDSFHWPKMHLWKGAKKLGSPPPGHSDIIQKKSSFFRETVPKFTASEWGCDTEMYWWNMVRVCFSNSLTHDMRDGECVYV